MKLLLAMLVAFAFGGLAVAHGIGDRIGPMWAAPGGAICDTAEQAKRAIDVYDSGLGNVPSGCGILKGSPRIMAEVIGMHKTNLGTYMLLKVTFLPPATLGVQYSWQSHLEEPDAIDGDEV